MKKRFILLIEDDFEIQGNGLGNVADLQYLPALALMNLAQKHGVKVTFMADVAHLLVLQAYCNEDRSLRLQKDILDNLLLLIKERGFDVQLHLHPQWLGAKQIGGHFQVSSNWNIGTYPADQQKDLLRESINYLRFLIQPHFPEYRTIAFKAGAWGLQPSQTFLSECSLLGIKIIIAVRSGLKSPKASIDYTNLEEKYLPYHPEIFDITRVSRSPNELVVVPLQPYAPDPVALTKLAVDAIRRGFMDKPNSCYYEAKPIAPEIKAQSSTIGKIFFRLSLRPYLTHLKIGNQPFAYLKASFDSVIKRLRRLDADRIPVVIESHTKQYHNYYGHIDRFLGHINDRYHNEIEFGDLTGFLGEIDAHPNLVRCKQRDGVILISPQPPVT